MDDHSEEQRKKIIGLGASSHRKSYYPELQEQIVELRRKNEELQQKSHIVTDSMGRSLSDVTAGDTAVKETLAVFGKIAESIDEVSQRISDVAATTEEQAASVEEISASVHEVGMLVGQTAKEAVSASAASEESASGLNQISHVIGDVTNSIQRISSAMERFRV